MSLRGNHRFLTFENMNAEDLRIYFEEMLMSNFDQERIIQLWDTNQERAIEEIRRLEPQLKYAIARQKWLEANNYYLYNILYFSDTVTDAAKTLLDKLFEYMNTLEPGYVSTPEVTRENTRLRKTILPAKRDALRNIMKIEISLS